MSSSELRYLIAANDLAKELQSVKQTDIANRLHVTKVSAYNAIERLREKEYIEKNDRKIVLTDRGREVLNEYMTIIRFMSAHLSLHCGTTENQAYEDALNATCAFSDAVRFVYGVFSKIAGSQVGIFGQKRVFRDSDLYGSGR